MGGVKVSMRVPEQVLKRVEEVSAASGRTRTEVMLDAITERLLPAQPVVTERKRGAVMEEGLPVEAKRAPVPLVSPEMRYRKPAHAADCKCWICRPPKEG